MKATERLVEMCCGCPFLEKEEWQTEDESGTDYTGCELGIPDPIQENKKALYGLSAPTWCKLREGPVLVKLRLKS